MLKRELESLLGHLNHPCSVVRPGRSFIGRLISLLTNIATSLGLTVRPGQTSDGGTCSLNLGTAYPFCDNKP